MMPFIWDEKKLLPVYYVHLLNITGDRERFTRYKYNKEWLNVSVLMGCNSRGTDWWSRRRTNTSVIVHCFKHSSRKISLSLSLLDVLLYSPASLTLCVCWLLLGKLWTVTLETVAAREIMNAPKRFNNNNKNNKTDAILNRMIVLFVVCLWYLQLSMSNGF